MKSKTRASCLLEDFRGLFESAWYINKKIYDISMDSGNHETWLRAKFPDLYGDKESYGTKQWWLDHPDMAKMVIEQQELIVIARTFGVAKQAVQALRKDNHLADYRPDEPVLVGFWSPRRGHRKVPLESLLK